MCVLVGRLAHDRLILASVDKGIMPLQVLLCGLLSGQSPARQTGCQGENADSLVFSCYVGLPSRQSPRFVGLTARQKTVDF